MCNCSPIPANICNQCAQGNTCGCPPDYTIMPQPTACPCCPPDYDYEIPTAAFPLGVCRDRTVYHIGINPIPCNPCVETISDQCVTIPAVPCLSFNGGTLADFLNYMCSEAYVLSFLQKIGISVTLKQAFCQIVAVCPVVGSTTPVLGPIIVTQP
jgi:hypothetical protein